MLLAASGVLAARLTSYERGIAWRRLGGLVKASEAAAWAAPLSGSTEVTQGIATLGQVALTGVEHLVGDAIHDLGHHHGGGHHDGGHHDAGDGSN